MTLRCLEPSGNGAEGTRSQWGTAGSAEEPSPEAARLAKALRELSQTGRERTGHEACGRGRLPKDAAGGCAGGERSWEVGPRREAKNGIERRPLASLPRLRAGDRGEDARAALDPWSAKGKWFSRDSGAWGRAKPRRAPWKQPLRALERFLFSAAARESALGLERESEKVPGASLSAGCAGG